MAPSSSAWRVARFLSRLRSTSTGKVSPQHTYGRQSRLTTLAEHASREIHDTVASKTLCTHLERLKGVDRQSASNDEFSSQYSPQGESGVLCMLPDLAVMASKRNHDSIQPVSVLEECQVRAQPFNYEVDTAKQHMGATGKGPLQRACYSRIVISGLKEKARWKPQSVYLFVANFSSAKPGGVPTDSHAERSQKSGKGLEEQHVLATRELLRQPWIDRWIPRAWRPFAHLARLDKPIGTWLLTWPCFWSIALAAPPGSLPDARLLALFGLGAVLLRGAGCTVNDILDRDIDPKVERTKLRPIAAGVLTPFQGLMFLGAQLLLGLGVLLQLNDFSKVLGASSLLLVGSYPLIKRWSFWPQVYLGLTFNWGALLGWAAVCGTVDLPVVLPLYASGVCWTVVYDTIYAHQDKEDDVKIGVKSTALRFGEDTRIWLTGFGAASVASLALAGYEAGLGWPFYPFVIISAGHLVWQISTVNFQSRDDCNKKFVSNTWLGALVFYGVILGKLWAV